METEAGLLSFRSKALRCPVPLLGLAMVGHLTWLVILSCGQLLSLMTLLLFDMLVLKIKAWYIQGRAKILGA